MDGLNIEALNHWTWWVLGVILIILEILAPGAVFLWLGVAAFFDRLCGLVGARPQCAHAADPVCGFGRGQRFGGARLYEKAAHSNRRYRSQSTW